MRNLVVQCTANGEEHGLIGTLTNSVEFDDFKRMKPEHAEECRKQKADDARMVRVKYINSRGKHERLTKPYCRYAGDPIQQWHLIPGHVYSVPYGFVKEVNAVKVPKRSGLVSLDGNDLNRDGSPLERDTAEEQLHLLVPADFSEFSQAM